MEKEIEGQGHCLECGREFYGRSDKKYCSDACRSRHNDRLYRESSLLRGKVITALNVNYRILNRLIDNKVSSISLYDAECLGFSKEIFTGCYRSRSGNDEKRCFDIRYRQTEKFISKIRKTAL